MVFFSVFYIGMGTGFILSPYPVHKKGAWCYAEETKETM
nr:MAG TPA: hypothetical protein [Caudoviricetes sp.]